MAENKKRTAAKTSGTRKKASPQKTRSTAKTQTRKKTASGGKSAAAAKTTKKLSAEIKGIIFIALGIFVALSFFTGATGIVGRFFKDVLMGLFGGAASIFFIFIVWTGINMFVEKKKEGSGYKVWVLFALMIVTSVLWSLWYGDTQWQYKDFMTGMRSMYTYGVDGCSGGIVGVMLCIGLVKFLGIVGTTLVSIAVLLILLIVLTEVSFEKLFRTIAAYAKRSKEQMAADLSEEIDMEVDDEAPRRKKKTKEHIPPEEVTEHLTRMPNNDYFDLYFAEDDIDSLTAMSENHEKPNENADDAEQKTEEKEHRPLRFTFDEDTADEREELLGDALDDAQNTENDDAQNDLPFSIDSIHTGVLTELPDEDGNFKEHRDDDDFEPPSLTQIQERVDPMTQAAIDAGVPLDSAVSAGKRMTHGEAEQAANSINTMAKENIEATRLINYKLPSVALLAKPKPKTKSRAEIKKELEDKANKLLETLSSFKVDARILNITQGPTVTRFELQPGFGIKVSKITNLADDIALSLAAPGVRIEAPIPGKSAIGIEIPNETPSPVPIREVIDTDKFRDFKSKTAFALGKDIGGNCIIADIAQFPHILIAGATGSGKSVCINSLITSILYKAKPNEVKMIMVDPKMVELGVYNGIPHLLIPVVTDPKHAAGALNWAVAEMKNRYQLLKDNKVRNIQGYNHLMEENGTPDNKLPEIVIIIDELADLMMAAKNEVEDAINSLAALARAAGMYLVIATQRPSVDVITGVIKANVPSRISFAVSSQIDSRTIIDSPGAEKLLGKGDMLYAPRGAIKPIRIQGNFLSDTEIENIIDYIKKQYEAEYDESILEHIEREPENTAEENDDNSHMRGGERDELFAKAAELVIDSGQASVAMLQRRFKVGYQRAARIIDQMEEYRVIGPYEGTKPRQVFMTRNDLNEMLMNSGD